MANVIDLQTISDSRGALTVIEKVLPFKIKRVYYMYDVKALRGEHRHKKTVQALIAVSGECKVNVKNREIDEEYLLDSPSKCLIVNPEDWHCMYEFSTDAVLLVLASEFYDPDDYISEVCK